MKPPFSFLPALPAATGLVAGILIFEYASSLLCLLSLAGCILIFFALYFYKHHYLSFYVLSTVAGICCSYASAHFRHPDSFLIPGDHFIEARVIEENSYSDSPSLTLEFLSVDSMPTYPFRCILSCPHTFNHELTTFLHSTIKLHCHLKQFSNQTDLPFEYDHSQSMYNDGICLMAYPLSDEILVSHPSMIYIMIDNIRNRIYNSIVNSPIDGDTAAFLLAIILGEKHYLDHGIVESFRSLGVAHSLALSGLHVGILASLFAFLIWPVRLLPHYRGLRVILLLGAVWTYTAVCGMGDSILRAAIMLSVLSISGLLQRSYFPANALLLAITLILSISPSSLFSPGFQLSVSAVASIIIFSPIVPKKLRKHPLRFFLANMIVLPIAAMIGTGLVSAYHFYTFPSAFLPANIIIGFVFPFILIGGFVLLIFTAIGIDFTLLGNILDFTLSSMYKAIEIIIHITPSPIGALHFSAWAFVPYFIAVVLIAVAVNRKQIVPAIAGAAFFIFTLVIIELSRPPIPESELYFVRRPSTCILIRSGSNATLITTCQDYDTLSTRQAVESRCQNFLKSRGCINLCNLRASSLNLKHFSLQDEYLSAGGKNLLILNSDTLTLSLSTHTNYLFVGQKYSGDLSLAIDIVKPDSIILAADINPSRRKRLLKEIADPTRLIDLRYRSFSIIMAK